MTRSAYCGKSSSNNFRQGWCWQTTTSASFAMGLAMNHKKTCVIDFDIGLRNLDLIMA